MKRERIFVTNNDLIIFIVQNTYGAGAKAVALRVAGDRAAFYACRILSYQDTLLDESGRHFYSNCYIEGATDFICGNAASLFKVLPAKPSVEMNIDLTYDVILPNPKLNWPKIK